MSRYELIANNFRADLTRSHHDGVLRFSLYLASFDNSEACGFVNCPVTAEDMRELGKYLQEAADKSDALTR